MGEHELLKVWNKEKIHEDISRRVQRINERKDEWMEGATGFWKGWLEQLERINEWMKEWIHKLMNSWMMIMKVKNWLSKLKMKATTEKSGLGTFLQITG